MSMKQGWQIKKLGEVCDMYQPKTISTKEMSENGLYPVFGANGIIGKYDKYNHEEPQLLITCRGATCGSVNISEQKSWINGNAMVIKPKDDTIDLKFLQYLFLGGIDFSRVITGSAQPQITRQSLNPVEMSYPPLSEQKRIVAILDEAFEAIARAKENTEQNLKNAKEIFESYLQLALTPPQGDALSPSNSDALSLSKWEEKKLGEVCEIRSGRNQKEVEDPKGIYPILGSAGKIMGYANKFICEEGTTIIGRKGTIDKPIFIEEKFWNVDTAFGLHALKELDKRFLFYFCKSYDFTKQDKGSGRPSLVKSDLLKINIPLPPLAEQKKIVQELDALKTQTEALEQIYTQKLNALDELQKSLLQKAFAGELVK